MQYCQISSFNLEPYTLSTKFITHYRIVTALAARVNILYDVNHSKVKICQVGSCVSQNAHFVWLAALFGLYLRVTCTCDLDFNVFCIQSPTRKMERSLDIAATRKIRQYLLPTRCCANSKSEPSYTIIGTMVMDKHSSCLLAGQQHALCKSNPLLMQRQMSRADYSKNWMSRAGPQHWNTMSRKGYCGRVASYSNASGHSGWHVMSRWRQMMPTPCIKDIIPGDIVWRVTLFILEKWK